jgi:hypothetical protein
MMERSLTLFLGFCHRKKIIYDNNYHDTWRFIAFFFRIRFGDFYGFYKLLLELLAINERLAC